MQTNRYLIVKDRAGIHIAGRKVEEGQTHMDLTEDEAKYGVMQGELVIDPVPAAPAPAVEEAPAPEAVAEDSAAKSKGKK